MTDPQGPHLIDGWSRTFRTVCQAKRWYRLPRGTYLHTIFTVCPEQYISLNLLRQHISRPSPSNIVRRNVTRTAVASSVGPAVVPSFRTSVTSARTSVTSALTSVTSAPTSVTSLSEQHTPRLPAGGGLFLTSERHRHCRVKHLLHALTRLGGALLEAVQLERLAQPPALCCVQRLTRPWARVHLGGCRRECVCVWV